MAQPIPIREADLREAMRDARYWQPGHPERAEFNAWVLRGWQALYPADGKTPQGGMVWVEPYSRVRDGRMEKVEGHWRAAPASASGSDADVVLAASPPRDPRDPRGRPLPLEGGVGGGSGGGGGRTRAPQAPAQTQPPAAPATAPRTVEEMRSAATLENLTKGNTRIARLPGDAATRDIHFQRLHEGYGRPPIVERMTDAGPVRFFDRADGVRITSRPSTDGRPTIAIARPRARDLRITDEFRFGTRSGE